MTIHINIGSDTAPVMKCNPRIVRGKWVRKSNCATCMRCLQLARNDRVIARHGRRTEAAHHCDTCGELATNHDGAAMHKRRYGCAIHVPPARFFDDSQLTPYMRKWGRG